ncbi:hypothetical protein IGI37_002321 [Enterococcus sp. AZ194]|uniref:hypothetical protein n=1 Tax=Enterococcus sp. AZ194 TaxID=2774629 RepID=UPI003F215723
MDWVSFLEKDYQQKLRILIYMREGCFTFQELANHFSIHRKTLRKRLFEIERISPQMNLHIDHKFVSWHYQETISLHKILVLFFSKSSLFRLLSQAIWNEPATTNFTTRQYYRLNKALFPLGFYVQEKESVLLGEEGAVCKLSFDFARDFPELCPKKIQLIFAQNSTQPFEGALSESLMTHIIYYRREVHTLRLPRFCWQLIQKDSRFQLFKRKHLSLTGSESLYLYLFLCSEASSDFSKEKFPFTLDTIYPIVPEIKQWLLVIQRTFPEFSNPAKQTILVKMLLQRLICRAIHTEDLLTMYEKERITQKLQKQPKMLARLKIISDRQPYAFTKNSEDKQIQNLYNYQMIVPILSSTEIEIPIHICLLLKLSESKLKHLEQLIQNHFSLFCAIRVSIHFGNEIPNYADICVTDYYSLKKSSNKTIRTIFISTLFIEELIIELTNVIFQLIK